MSSMPRSRCAMRHSTESCSSSRPSTARSASPAAAMVAQREGPGATDRLARRAPAPPPPRGRRHCRRRRTSAGACPESSRTPRAAPCRCRTRCRRGSSSRSPAGSRCRTCAGACGEPARRQNARARGRTRSLRARPGRRRSSCQGQASLGRAAGLRVGGDQLADVPAGAPSISPSTRSTMSAISRKPMRAVQEGRRRRPRWRRCTHRGTCRRVHRPRAQAASSGKSSDQAARSAAPAPPPGRAARRRRRPLGIRERERDRHRHVGMAEMREQGAVAEANERVHHRRRVHDDLDPLVRARRRASAPRSARAPCSQAWRSPH